MWENNLINELKNQVQNYPTKQLLELLLELNHQQQERIEHLKSQVDGVSWSPEQWRD